jgi:hypothetical protein
MALFSSEMADLKNHHQACTINATSQTESEYACLRLSHGLSFKCKSTNYSLIFQLFSLLFKDDNIYAYNRYGIISPRCNQPSWIAWFLLIQYFFLAKRFLTSLLTAMFG